MLQSLFKKFKKPFEFGIPYIDVKYFKKNKFENCFTVVFEFNIFKFN